MIAPRPTTMFGTMSTSPNEMLADALEARNIEAAAALRDGRRMRAERGRAAVLTAAYELVNSGEHTTIAMIAERAGVSERTVFRYFPDREALMAGIAGELFPIIEPYVALDVPDVDFDARLDQLLRRRVELVQIGGRFAAAVDHEARSSALGQALRALRTEQLREQTRLFLGPDVVERNAAVLPVIDALLDHTPITGLLDGNSADDVVAMLRVAVERLLQR